MSSLPDYPVGEKVYRVMNRGRNTGLQDGFQSMAPLDQTHIMMLVEDAGFPDAKTVSRDMLITAEHAKVAYKLELRLASQGSSTVFIAGRGSSTVFINITRMQNADKGSEAMRDHLAAYQSDIEQVLERSASPYGNTSLQTQYSIIWAHYAHFVQVITDQIPLDNSVPAIASSSGDGGAPTADGVVDIRILHKIASKLNQHLMLNNIRAEQVSGPLLSLKTPLPLQVIRGRMLKVELNGMADIDESKSVRFEKKGKLYRNQATSEEGDIVFFAKEAGTCRVAILVAHREYLTVGKIDVDVVIQEPSSSIS